MSEDNLTIKSAKTINVSALGVDFTSDVSIEDWESFGEQIGKVVNSSQFIIGDWLNYGRSRWEKKEEYAKRIAIAEEKTGLDRESLKKYAMIARKVSFENRSPKCSFSHHIPVAKLEPKEQTKWLKIADEKALSTKLLKASIKAGKPLCKASLKSKADSVHTYDDCLVFVHDIHRWYTRKKNAGFFDKLTLEQLQFERKKLVPVAEIYNELNQIIRFKQVEN